MRNRESYIAWIGALIAIAVVIAVVLALLSPQIGSIFSNITADLAAAPTDEPPTTAVVLEATPRPTGEGTGVRAETPTITPTPTPTAEAAVAVATVAEDDPTLTPTPEPNMGEEATLPRPTLAIPESIEIEADERVTGSISGDAPVRLYTYSPRASGLVSIAALTTDGDLEPVILVLDEAGDIVAQGVDASAFSDASFLVERGQTYLIVVTDLSMLSTETGQLYMPEQGGGTGDFMLQLVLEPDAEAITGDTSTDTPEPTSTPQSTPTLEPTPTVEAAITAETTAEAATTEESVPTEEAAATEEPTPEPPPEPTRIGRGEITVENRDTVEQGDTVTVELVLGNITWEAFFDPPEEEGMDAAVEGARTINPPAMLAGGAVLPQTTPVTRMERVPVYPRMGAWIQCPPQALSGCDNELPGKLLPPITGRADSFTWPAWILTASADYAGILEDDVRIYVYYVADPDIPVDEITVENIQYIGDPIRVPLQVVAVSEPPNIALIAGIALGVLTLGGVVAYAISRNRPHGSTYSGDESKPQVFISYRRGISWSLARSVANSLQQRGADVFIDVDDINEGRFASTIEQAIQDADYVVPILAPGTLESAWVRREIAYALAHDKVMVPLLVEGFQLDAADLPDEIRDMASHNAITIVPEFYEEALDRLASRFLKLE